jgi:ATP-dependent 26S proteasome regulatory subunit
MIKTIFESAKKLISGEKKKKQVILFDECDSLLMDRNEVGAILGAQVNALLSEIEHYDGIIIFTTNRLGKLDPALERRITAKIEFPFPDRDQREKIWRRMIPKQAPIDKSVDFEKLAEYPIPGGNIKNSVLNAARFAAYSESPTIKMKHFTDAIEREAQSIQAFVAEYESQTHTSLKGALDRSSSGISVSKRDVIDTVMKKDMKKTSNIIYKKGRKN